MLSGKLRIVLALVLAEAAGAFETSMIYAALPSLIRDLGSAVLAGWLVTGYSLVATAACLVVGRIGETMGRRRLVVLLLLLSAAGSAISASGAGVAPVLAGRALQGLSAAVLPLCIGIARDVLARASLPMGIGLITSAASGGVAAGLVLGGLIVDNLDWHAMFVASAALLIAAAVTVRLVVPADRRATAGPPVDWLEGLMPVPAVTALLLALSLGKPMGWTHPAVLGLAVGGALLLACWTRLSLASPAPFIDLRLLLRRDVAIANGVSILLAVGTMQSVLVFSTYMQAPRWTLVGLGLSATLAGLAKLPSNLCSLFAGPISGRIAQAAGTRRAMIAGGAVITLGWAFALTLPQSLPAVVALICVISFGTTMLFASVPNVMVTAVPASRAAEITGSMTVVRTLFMAVGSQVVSVLLATATVTHVGAANPFPSARGFVAAIAWIVAVSAAALLLSLRLPPGRTVPDAVPTG